MLMNNLLKNLKKYGLNLFIAVDQLINTILLGDPDETISSRAGKNRTKPGWKQLCWLLSKVDPKHCAHSIEKDEGKDAIL